MAHDGLDQQEIPERLVIDSPAAGGDGTVSRLQLSGVVGPVMVPETMAGVLVVVAPMRTQVDDVGQAIWVREPNVAGRVSAAKVTEALAVVAP
jgi:hypothetical protein